MANDSFDRIRTATFTVGRRGYDKREVDDYLSKLADWLEGGGGDQAARDTVRNELERIGQKTGRILTAAEDAGRSIRSDAQEAAQEVVDDARREADSVRAAADGYSSEARADADDYASRTRADVDGYARQTRSDADGYSAKTRNEADAYSGKKREEADAYEAGTRQKADSYDEDTRAEADHAGKQAVAAAEAKARAVIEKGNARRAEIEKVIADLEKRRDAVLSGLQKLSTDLAGTATSYEPGEGPDGAAAAKPAARPRSKAAAEEAE